MLAFEVVVRFEDCLCYVCCSCCGVLLFILCLAGWVDFGVLVYWFLLVFVLLYD